MMGSTAIPAQAEEGAIALLKVIGDPKQYQERLGALAQKIAEAQAAEQEGIEQQQKAQAKLDEVNAAQAKLEKDTEKANSDLAEARAKQQKAQRDLDDAAAALEADKKRSDEEAKKRKLGLDQREAQLDQREAAAKSREADLDKRDAETSKLNSQAGKDARAAEKLRGSFEDKIARLTDAIKSI